jgi:hypothetical protein
MKLGISAVLNFRKIVALAGVQQLLDALVQVSPAMFVND